MEYKEPTNLDEVVAMLYRETAEYRATQNVDSTNYDEKFQHHGFGRNIRNNLNLWWSESLRDHVLATDPNSDYPREKPALVAWFNERNIYHADDMSDLINRALKAFLAGKEFDFDKACQRYFRHWKQFGYKDGICLPEYKIGPDPEFLTLDDDWDEDD